MTQSSHSLIQVLVYNESCGIAFWCTPSEAARYMSVWDGHAEVIEPFDSRFNATAKQAGPMPERIITV